MTRILIALLVALCLSVSWESAAAGQHRISKTIFVLFDLSGSTATSKIRQEYLENFKRIVDPRGFRDDFYSSFLSPGDVLIADVISGNSISESSFPIRLELKKYSYWLDNRFRYAKYLRTEKENVIHQARALLLGQKRKIMSTDILSALRVAERVFKSFIRDRAVLIIMSDMLEESGKYNFAKMRLTTRRIRNIIKTEETRGLPDLKDVEVYIAGCRASDRQQFMAVRDFWLKYFKRCGAVLKPENYGRALAPLPTSH